MSSRNVVQSNLQNNLRQITDLLDNRISTDEDTYHNMMRTSNIHRQHRQMTRRLQYMYQRLQRTIQLLNAYIAVVVHRVPPPRQIQSRRIQQAYQLFHDANIWHQYPGIVQSERRRLTNLSIRFNELFLQVRGALSGLYSLSRR